MAATGNHTMHAVHAHFNLLGWVTMGIFAFFYRLWPEAADSRLAKLHFWTYVPAHFIQTRGGKRAGSTLNRERRALRSRR